MSGFRAALLQMRSGTDIGRNVKTFSTMVREAAANGATYVQSPEMTGALVRDRVALKTMLKDEAADPVAASASELARSLGIHVHVGSTAIAAEGGKVANRAFLFGPDGAKIATYDKIHMFDVDPTWMWMPSERASSDADAATGSAASSFSIVLSATRSRTSAPVISGDCT